MIKDAYAFLNVIIFTLLVLLIHLQVVPSFGGKAIAYGLDIDDLIHLTISLLQTLQLVCSFAHASERVFARQLYLFLLFQALTLHS